MRLLFNMDNKTEIGYIDWEFIHDMQGIAPELITPEVIYLTPGFLRKIPKKWKKIKSKLKEHVDPDRTIHCAISDIENLGNEFKLRGTLKNKEGEILDFYKVVVFDKDRIEDDYIGAVITDKKGNFTLSFGKKTFSDFGLEAEPDIYFKVYQWQGNRFVEIGKTMPEVFEKTETIGNKILYEFGIVTI
ncbi:MAG: hypothetical protein JSV88_13070 [Candidatus Aminicenantes bacterium]|nr:MAG: hypothetical protein JSV88_13070 [Candidatus Aminicenantes bacterium]